MPDKAGLISFQNTISPSKKRESLYWLRLLQATNKLDERADPLIHECDRIVAVLTTIVKKTKGTG